MLLLVNRGDSEPLWLALIDVHGPRACKNTSVCTCSSILWQTLPLHSLGGKSRVSCSSSPSQWIMVHTDGRNLFGMLERVVGSRLSAQPTWSTSTQPSHPTTTHPYPCDSTSDAHAPLRPKKSKIMYDKQNRSYIPNNLYWSTACQHEYAIRSTNTCNKDTEQEITC